MEKNYLNTILTTFICILVSCSIALADITADRKQATELTKQSNWKEALELHLQNFTAVSDDQSHQDLIAIYDCMRDLSNYAALPETIATVKMIHSQHSKVLLETGRIYSNIVKHGRWIDNQFERGHRARGPRRGQSGSTIQHDRVQSLNFYQRSYNSAKDDKQKVNALRAWQQAIITNRFHSEIWRLQELTDTTKIPEIEKGYHHSSKTQGAPTTIDGNPLFYEVPESYQAARNDGERYRWIIHEIVRLKPSEKNTLEFTLANFLHQQFSVRTLQSFSWYHRLSQDKDKKSGIMQIHTLSDNETIAKLANTVKRFELPDSQNFILLYSNLFEGGYLPAGDSLAEIYLDRRQYTKAAAILKTLVEKYTGDAKKHRLQKLNQIVNDWCQFGHGGEFIINQEKHIELIYRNASSVTLSIQPIDMVTLHQDAWEYLKSNPRSLKWEKIQWHNLLNDLINKSRKKYLGEQIAQKKYNLSPRDGHWDARAELKLPELKNPGAYIVKATLPDGKECFTQIWVEDMMVASKEIKEGTLYYTANAETGDPISDVELTFQGYEVVRLKKKKLFRSINVVTQSFTVKTDVNGQVIIPNNEKHRRLQWSVSARKGERKAWMGFRRVWSYDRGDQTYQQRKIFGITSQPVYKPGSKVEGKFWIRDVRYDLDDTSSYAAKPFWIQLYDPMNQKVGKPLSVTSNSFGGIHFEYEIPEDAKLGNYRAVVHMEHSNSRQIGYTTFRVEKYKKPEYEVSIEAPTTPVMLGDHFEATIKASYYHGAPVTNASVKVKVLRHKHSALWFPKARWDWLYGSGYGWLDIERSWYPDWQVWGCRCPYPHWHHGGYEQPELVIDEEMKIGKDGTVKVKIDSALAKLVHANSDHRYEIKAEVIDASRRTIFGSGSVLAARRPFNVTTWLNRGYALIGEKITASTTARTLDGKIVKGTGTATLKRVEWDLEGKLTETKIQSWELSNTNQNTFKDIDFQINQVGQYRLISNIKDEKGREIQGAVLFSVRGTKSSDTVGNVRYNDLELIPDKREYAAGDTIKLLINTKRKNSHVMLFIRGNETRQFITIENHSTVVEIPVAVADMPNFYIEAMTISNGNIHSSTREIIVPPAKRVLNVEILADAQKYKPQDKGTITVRVTDENGNPVKGDCVLSIYDKSLEYIAGGSGTPAIKPFFWKWRRHYYNTHWTRSWNKSGGTVVKQHSPSMQFLGSFGHSLNEEFGVDTLGKTDSFRDDGTAGGFGNLRAKSRALSAPSAPAASEMADLTVAYDAESEGDPFGDEPAAGQPITIRKDFADLIKWVGSVTLDDDGKAEIPVDFPDNLTTWKISTWAMSHGTRVGEGSTEVITSKDLIIRLQAPRFFVEKDEVVLSAVVHNYHDQPQQAKVLLELEGGTLVLIDGDSTQQINLEANNGEQRINWRVKASKVGDAIIRMKVISNNDSDAMEMTFPVHVHGMLKQMAWSREISADKNSTHIEIEIPAERRPEDSRLEVRYSPTIAATIIDALPYLAEYPYGCTEQTLNRFVPTVITQKLLQDMGINLEDVRNKRTNLNPQEIGDDTQRMKQWQQWQSNPVFSHKEVNKMVLQGIVKLTDMQNSDGGWGWFSGYGEHSYPHTTAVVVHGLKTAKSNGAVVPEQVIKRGVAWLKNFESKETEKIRMWGKREVNTKKRPSTDDAFVRLVLAENNVSNPEMLDLQFLHKGHYGIYAKSLLGMSLHLSKDAERRDAVIRNIEQFLKYDAENQTAYLEMANSSYWWYWYGSEFEAHAWYLKLLAATKPESKQARGIVKYLINNRKHATYWNSTRDTAYCIEAIADYIKASGEGDPNAEVEVLLDGKSYKKVSITKENLFSFDNKMTLAGDILSTGKHTIEIRRTGKGPLYTNAYLTVFTKENNIKKAGLEVKVERRFYKLVPKKATTTVAGDRGQVIEQKTDEFQRIPLKNGDLVKSGDTIEVELIMESKNDYEYLLFSDFKAAGTEAEKARSGYISTGSMHAYMEVHDEKVCFFIRQLPRGKHSLTYKLRAEIPGKFSALPATADAMYAPELRANSDEMKLEIQ